jgi:predicted RNase H-like HicB family nuclease
VGIELSFRLSYVLTPREKWIIASCPALDVHSQGETEELATSNLREAIQLFLETCVEMGTLDRVLRDSGLRVSDDREAEPGTRTMEIPLHLMGGKDAQNIPG